MNDLFEYLDFLQVNFDYTYQVFFMHTSAVCSILQPMDHIRASKAPLIK